MKVLHMGGGEVPARGPFLLTNQLVETEWAQSHAPSHYAAEGGE